MKFPAKSVVWLLPLLLTGCFHKAVKTQPERLAPPIVDAPPPKPEPVPTDLPPAVVTVPNRNPSNNANTYSQEEPKPPVKRKKTAPVAKNTEVASAGSPGVSAIGQLSSATPSGLLQETVDSLAATDHGLNAISRDLSDLEKKTVVQIKEFLKQAKTALNSGDVDGAHTLAAKAKVLLEELAH